MPYLMENDTSFVFIAHIMPDILHILCFQDGGQWPSWI